MSAPSGFVYSGTPTSGDVPKGPRRVSGEIAEEKGSTHVPHGSTFRQDGEDRIKGCNVPPVTGGVQGSSFSEMSSAVQPSESKDGSYHGVTSGPTIKTPSRPKPRDQRRGR